MHIKQEQYSLTKSYLNKLKQYPNFVKDIMTTIVATTGQFVFAPFNIYLYMKVTKQKFGQTIDSDQIKRISMNKYKNCLSNFIFLLPFKDYFRNKFSFLQQTKNKQQITTVDIFYCFMINCSCVSLFAYVRAAILFTFGRHKIENVNFLVQEQQRMKYYKEQGKSKKFIVGEWLKARNNGFLAFILGAGGFSTLSISLFDTLTIFSSKTESKSKQFLYNFSLGFLFYSISEIICLPFLQATKIKRKQIIIKDPSKPYLFQSQSYKEIWLKVWKNKKKLIPQSRLIPFSLLTWTKNSFILSTYFHIQQYIMANSTLY